MKIKVQKLIQEQLKEMGVLDWSIWQKGFCVLPVKNIIISVN